MATQYAFGKIVTDGLVLALDAADRNSYPGSGTTWTDLSGNGNNGTLVNGPLLNSLGGGSIGFDGTDYANFSTILNYTTESFSFSYWVYFNSLTTNQAGQGPIVLWKGNYQTNGYYDQIATNGAINFITNQSSAFQITSTNSGTIVPVTWYNICYVRNGSSIRIYVNGTDLTSIAGTHINPLSAVSNNFRLATYSLSIYSNLRIGNFTNYNKALSALEIQQNYNAQKSRFGL